MQDALVRCSLLLILGRVLVSYGQGGCTLAFFDTRHMDFGAPRQPPGSDSRFLQSFWLTINDLTIHDAAEQPCLMLSRSNAD